MVLLPSVWQQLRDVFLGGLVEVRHGGDDGVEVEPRVYVVVAAGGKQRLDYAHVFGRLVVAAGQIVLASERNRTDLVLGKVVVGQQAPVVEDSHHAVPAGVGVGYGL